MSYSPEEVSREASGLEAHGYVAGPAMLRTYAATLRQQATRVDESAIERLRNALKMFDEHRTTMQSLASSVGDFLRESALSAQPAPIPTPQQIFDYLAMCERLRKETAQPAERQGEGKPQSADDVLAAKRYLRDWVPDSVRDYVAALEAKANPAPVGVPEEVRKALEFYAGGGHIVALHIRNRKAGEPEGYAWWPAKRAELEAKGYSAFGEGDCGAEHFVEGGDTAQAALDSLAAAPSAPQGEGSARERLEDERWRLMNSFGNGPVADGQTRDRIAEIDAQLATTQPAERK
jgi:hypothetical protein